MEPLLTRTQFILKFTPASGPAFTTPFARVAMLADTVTVELRITDGEPEVANVRVAGTRARKDGTPGAAYMTGNYLPIFTESWATMPANVRATVDEALRLVRDMLRHTPEVLV